MRARKLSFRSASLALATLTAAGITSIAAPASASSMPCLVNGSLEAMSGIKVAVSDKSSTFPTSCIRLWNEYRSGNRVTIDFGVRDTAQDGQRAIVNVRFLVTSGPGDEPVWTAPTRLITSGVEADVNFVKQFNLQETPIEVAYQLGRVTNAGVENTLTSWHRHYI